MTIKNKPCPICGSTDLSKNIWIIGDGETEAVECNACYAGAPLDAWNKPRPTQKTFKEMDLMGWPDGAETNEKQNKSNNVLNVLDEIIALAKKHPKSPSTLFITDAFMSYVSSKYKCYLSDYTALDFHHMDIFQRMLQYRNTPGWKNSAQDDTMNAIRKIIPNRWN